MVGIVGNRRLLRGALSLGVLSFSGAAAAQSLATSARQLPKGSLKILAYYEGIQGQDLTFTVNNAGSCASPNGVSFACGQSGDVSASGSGGAGMIKVLYQPWESLQYYGAIGAGDYSLSVPSVTVTNVLTGDNPGLILTAGAKAVLIPDTIVTPAVAVDASLTKARYSFNRRAPGGTPGQNNNIDQRLDLTQYQVAVEASHLFTIEETYKVEPYGGVKWLRVQSDLKDLTDGSHAGGADTTVTPFVGVRLPAYEHEAFFAEASFVGGYRYAAGLEVRF